MNKTSANARSVTEEPGFTKPAIGDVVAIRAVDWGFESEQYPSTAGFTIVRGTLFGMVIAVNEEWVTIAPQVFDSGDVRCALSIPWVCVGRVALLQKADDDATR